MGINEKISIDMGFGKNTNNKNWTVVLQSETSWFNFDFRELWKYRDLIWLFVRRDFVAVYKQTILGPVWFLLQPIFTTVTFTVIFSSIAKIPTDGSPPTLFYMTGIVVWNYFSGCLMGTSNTFVRNAGIFGKVYFPRLVVPFSVVISNVLTFLIQFMLLMGVLIYFYVNGAPVAVRWGVIFVPLIVIHMAMLGLGTGILISSMTTKYRDLTFAVGFGVQLWMYATPIVYPLSQVPEKWYWIAALNPMTAIVETVRYILLGKSGTSFSLIGESIFVTFFIMGAGVIMFNRVEKNFMDTV